ncbi:hypothetical protein PPACK8108_LOCUS25707 [Phakopsora pachyrhizi]|uniref:Uncharacterized protein n=1 Tax=Phakopsora pachyrhizi TaxID=170000 RepID=A0AAV0BV82_PHAPC|nr:hypothetical protein PPACK8108_LOCUS25707 [Phakopsora pachyrhizi]
MFAWYLSFILLLLIFSNDSKCSFKEGLSGLKRRLSFPDIKDPSFEIPALNEPNFFFNHPHALDSSEGYPITSYGVSEGGIKRDKDISMQSHIKIGDDSLVDHQHQNLHRTKKLKTDQSEMEAGYEDLKNCIQETKKQIWWPRHIEGLKKIEKTLENDLSSIMFEGIDDNCFKTLSEVLSSYENVLKPGRPISSVPVIPLIFKILDYIEKFELQANRMESNKSLIKKFFNEKELLKQLIWYISTVLIQKWGFIGVFLTSLDTEHWKEIELGFLKAHKKLEYNKNIFKENFSEYEKRFSKYEEFISENQSILKNVKDIEKPLPNVYKIIVTNPKNTSLKNFIECTFAYHVHNYLKRYKKNFKLGNLVKEKEEVFEAFFKVFQNILKVINALEESFNLERGIRRKIYCLSPFLLELQNLMPSPDFNKYQYIGNQNKISFKTANSKSFLKSCYFELNKSGVSNIFMTLNDLKQEYGLLKTQMRFWKYNCKFSKKSIDSWHRTIKNYMEFSESILKDIIQ